MKKIKAISILGTRPEAIKMAPIIKQLEKERFDSVVVVTGQHKEMLDQVIEIFEIKVDYNLDIMKKNQCLQDITCRMIHEMSKVIAKEKPDVVLVHGDTTTAFAASLAAFYQKVKIGHIEAGLRTGRKYSPFPEEMNRQMIDTLSDFYFAPTKKNHENLLKENISAEKIFITGNTVIDTLHTTVNKSYTNKLLDSVFPEKKLILLTMHRRENQGKPMINTFKAVRKLANEQKNIIIVYPVHLNPKIQMLAKLYLGEHPRIHLLEPLNVVDFHNYLARSYFVMSDSGGIQEEATALGKPVLVLRDTTERSEGETAGILKLIGTDSKQVYSSMKSLLDNNEEYLTMSQAENIYGDGTASIKIVEVLNNKLSQK